MSGPVVTVPEAPAPPLPPEAPAPPVPAVAPTPPVPPRLTHEPLLQTSLLQAFPQLPQLSASDAVLTHLPLQEVWPAGHVPPLSTTTFPPHAPNRTAAAQMLVTRKAAE